MPMGARECNLNIHDNSIRLRLEVMVGSKFGVHHSSKVNCICLWLCPSLLKCLETGVSCPSFRTVALCSYILFSKDPGGFSHIMFVALSTGYHLYDIIKFTCDLFWSVY